VRSAQVDVLDMAQHERDGAVRMEMLPGQMNARLAKVENDRQRQGGVAEDFGAVRALAEAVGPRLARRGVMVDLDDRPGESGNCLEDVGRKRKVEDEDLVSGNFGHFPGLTVMHGTVAGAGAEAQPGGIGRAEAVRAVGMVENGDRAGRHGLSNAAGVRRAGCAARRGRLPEPGRATSRPG